MNILWVKAGGLVPPDSGGKIRSYNILRQLAKQHEVTFFSFYAVHENDVHAELNQFFKHVILVPLKLPAAKSAGELWDYLTHVFSRVPYNLAKYCQPVVRRKLLALLEQEQFDVILCDFLVAAGAIPWDFPGPKVLFTHNVETVIWRRHYELAKNPLWKALSWREWKTMAAAEQQYLKRADHVLAVSENDRKDFLKFMDPTKVTVVPTGVDTEFFQPSQKPEAPNSLVFTGSMDWLPNEDGISYFAHEIFPLIQRKAPDAILRIVGRKPSSRLKDLAARVANIELTGWVEDVRPYLAQSSVCIVPLRIGGGTRLKIFEAMSMAKAVVSTSIGAEGLPVIHGEHLLIADDPARFAECTLDLLRDTSRRARFGQAARKLVEKNYSWVTVASEFAQILEKVVKQAH